MGSVAGSATGLMYTHVGTPKCRGALVITAAGRQAPRRSTKEPRKRSGGPKLPESGYFAIADPKAELYVPKNLGSGDFTKRGGRYASDFIWNTNWQEQLDYQEAQQRTLDEAKRSPPSRTPGGLSLARSLELESVDVDMTEQLRLAQERHRRQREAAASQAAAAQAAAAAARAAGQLDQTQGEARRWQRSGRYVKKLTALELARPGRAEQSGACEGHASSSSADLPRQVIAQEPTSPEDMAALEEARAAEEADYQRLKAELQSWCLGTAALCFLITLACYDKDTAVSYGFGSVGSLVYLRLLNRSMDAVGSFSVGAALGQPRLLIPVILTLVFNRWNTLAAEQTGITLLLLPMLLGFFTYKAAVVAKTTLSLFAELTPGRQQPQQQPQLAGDASAQDQAAATSSAAVDRALNIRALTQ